ncbi:MAG: pyridoxal phosphate-dependent aminotransferase [Candidatus Kariarchaeaceae archaeon]|jgi:aspartate aminotransferase
MSSSISAKEEEEVPHILDRISLGKIVQIRDKLLEAQANGKAVYRFESGDPNFAIAPHIQEAIQEAVTEGKTHYTPNNGILQLREAVLEKLRSKNKIQVSSVDNIFITNGAMNALFAIFTSLLSKEDEVIIPSPMWTEIGENIKLGGGKPIPIPLSPENDYQYSVEAIKSKITSKTKAIFLNTPHNPTGAILSKDTLRDIVQLAKKYDLWIISDEAYEDVVYTPYSHYSVASLAPEYLEKIVSVFSFSKSYAMSGLRLGYIATTSPLLMSRIPKILRCSINGVNSISQWGAVAALNGDQSQIPMMQAEYAKRRDMLFNALKTIPGFKPFYPRGAFYIWVQLDPAIYDRLELENAEAISDYLASNGVGSTPGNAFGEGCEDALRFAFSCDTRMVEEGALALRNTLLQEK